MNRLVIIGNGFDLAHGLPTSYRDFIEDYFIEALTVFFNEKKYEDELISISFQRGEFVNTEKFNNIKEVFILLERYSHYIKLIFNSPFFKGLKNKLDMLNWVDIENEYFEELKKCKGTDGNFDYMKVSQLNLEFEFLKKKLGKYLIKTIQNYSKTINPSKYSRYFCEPISMEEVVLRKMSTNQLPENLLFLNFNYTSILESYYHTCIRTIPKTNINFIHGELDFKDNPIIFGFGDEYDKSYKEFEDKKNNILFEHIKSFGYFKTPNYHNLIRFLDSDDYQVYIFGHSCGLSDRTMLKQIFEDDKCVSIKIFYHDKGQNKNDYVEKTMEISRHFDDKGLMRKKIVPFPLSKSM